VLIERKSILALLVGGSMLAGVAVGAIAFGVGSGRALAATNPAASASPGTRTFTPNEDPAHEAGESAEREAQEDAGQVPTVKGLTRNGGPGGAFTPNEDPAHEAGESAAREAQEDAGQRPTVP
jgi:hypothetical protein